MEDELGHLKGGSKMVFRQVMIFQPIGSTAIHFLLSLFIHHAFNRAILPVLDKEVCKLQQLPTTSLADILNGFIYSAQFQQSSDDCLNTLCLTADVQELLVAQ